MNSILTGSLAAAAIFWLVSNVDADAGSGSPSAEYMMCSTSDSKGMGVTVRDGVRCEGSGQGVWVSSDLAQLHADGWRVLQMSSTSHTSQMGSMRSTTQFLMLRLGSDKPGSAVK